jgi:hypothetical protein
MHMERKTHQGCATLSEGTLMTESREDDRVWLPGGLFHVPG